MKDVTAKIRNRIIQCDASIFDAMKMMDSIRNKILFVYQGGKYLGMLTIGDIQRSIIRYNDTSLKISRILDKEKIVAHEGESMEEIKEKMMRLRAECMPVVTSDGQLADVIFWKEIFLQEKEDLREKIDLPVVIMAGGMGTRLRPLTNVIPKPMIPVGEKTIIEIIMDRFHSIGCSDFHISVNYKSEILAWYLNGLEKDYRISLFKEDKPLGTIGSVKLLQDTVKTPFIVSNCDNIIEQDFRDVYEYHRKNHNDLTMVTAVKSYRIPYGVVETEENGLMKEIIEKPEYTYMINTGVYILEPHLIGMIPEGKMFHITDLMEDLRKAGGKIGCFPVSENAWTDIGDWKEYIKQIDIE